jgi:hypothetical protein
MRIIRVECQPKSDPTLTSSAKSAPLRISKRIGRRSRSPGQRANGPAVDRWAAWLGSLRRSRCRGWCGASGGGSIWDPGRGAFLVPVLILIVIGGVATWLPSRRALKINPADLLRTT